jgi:hypothetical protein
MGLSGKGWATYLAEESDLDAVIRAVAREQVVRHAMAETGEDRRTVEDMLDASWT